MFIPFYDMTPSLYDVARNQRISVTRVLNDFDVGFVERAGERANGYRHFFPVGRRTPRESFRSSSRKVNISDDEELRRSAAIQ